MGDNRKPGWAMAKKRVYFIMAATLAGVAQAASAPAGDAAWARTKAAYLAKPRRVIVDDDGCDATNFPKGEKPTVENFYAQMLDHMVGNQFDVLVYCPCTTGLAVLNRTKTGLRHLASLPQYTNITSALDREFDTDPLRLAHDFARSNGYEFVVNMRANDTHDAFYPAFLHEFKRQRPELLVGATDRRPPFGDWSSFDFAQSEVRALFKTIVCEWFDAYDPDGFMIDFRGHCLFKSVAWGGRPTETEMADYAAMLREIRAHAESVGRKRGRPIYFMFRVPDSPEICRLRGMDIVAWADEELFDFCIAGSDGGHYGLWRETAAFCREKGLKFYPSVDITWMKSAPEIFKRNCHEGFTGLIAAAYAAGADGIYMFNMFYAADYFSKVRRNLSDLATFDKKYFVTTHMPWRLSAYQPAEGERGLRKVLYPEYGLVLGDQRAHDYVIEVGDDFAALPKDGPQPTVKLYLKCSAKKADELKVALNGKALRAASLTDAVAVFPVEPRAVKKGENILTIAAAGAARREREVLLAGDAPLTDANRRKWRRLFAGNAAAGSERIVEGAFRLATTTNGAANLLYPIGNGCGQPLEAEFVLQVEAGAQPGSVSARLANGTSVEVFDFMPGRVRMRHSAHQCDFETERSHAYRVRVADGAAELWADGRRLLTGTVGKNVGNVACHLRGQHLRVAGMDESSFLIGAVDPVAGAGRWKDVALIGSSLAVNDAMLEVKFPFRVSDGLRAAAQAGGTPLHFQTRTFLDHDRGEYACTTLKADHPAVAGSGRRLVAKWRVRCVGEPRTPGENAFQVVLRPPVVGGAKGTWECAVKMRDGQVVTPFGVVRVPSGEQTLTAAVDSVSGEAVILDGDGKALAGGLLPRTKNAACVIYGDGSSAISGKVVLEELKVFRQ